MRRISSGRRRVVIGVTVCASLAISACGGSGPSATGGSGKQLFQENCGSCHTLAAAGTSGASAPNLDALFARQQPATIELVVLHQIANGGGGMPAGILSDGEAKKVAAYVASAVR